MAETFKSPRPLPILINDSTFSHKKAKKRSLVDDYLPPRPPVKSAPPISRIFKHSRKHSEGAHAVSFTDNGNKLESPELTSPHYNSKSKELYFKQCFEVICKLGTGSFGEVYKVKSKEDGYLYAIKKSRERFRGDVDRRYKLEEVNKHELLRRHPNCVRFVKAWEERQHLYIQTELCNMSLKNYLESMESLPENEIWSIIVDLTLGLKHLHDHNLVHMDIKPANVFIGMDRLYKIGDFGLVLEISKVEITDAQEGDPMYLAPELMQGSFTKAADIFSLGITMLEAACDLELPRGGDTWHQLRNGQLPEVFIEGLSPALSKLISWMMHPDPDKRPTVDQILAESTVKEVWKRRKWLHYYSWMVFTVQHIKVWTLIMSFAYFCITIEPIIDSRLDNTILRRLLDDDQDKRMQIHLAVSSYASKLYQCLSVFIIWIVCLIIWPFKPIKRIWSSAEESSPSHDVSVYSDSSSLFSLEDSHNMSHDSVHTPDKSSSGSAVLDDSFGDPIARPPWHKDGYCTSPTVMNGRIPTPTSHTKVYRPCLSPAINPINGRLTPPLDTSSPSRGQYTPPSEGRRGRLFEDDGITAKVGVGPKNLLDVFEDAAI